MATPVFTPAFITRLEDRVQAYRFDCIIGPVVVFKFYCCGSPPILGVDKAPVCILDIDPEIQCVNVNIAFDIDASYSPTGNLAGQPYLVNYGNGVTAGGNWGPPGPWNYAYPAAGIYTVEAYVTDTLGVRGSTSVTVEVIDCANDSILIEYMYALSATTGPWVRDMVVGGAPPPWTQRILGLTGNWLNGRDLTLDPHRKHLPYGQRHVWIATQAGVAKSVNDMVAWGQLYSLMPEPLNTAGDGVPPTKANLDWVCIAFNPLVRDEVYVLAYDTVIAPTRVFVYWTTDGGATWLNWEVSY